MPGLKDGDTPGTVDGFMEGILDGYTVDFTESAAVGSIEGKELF